MKTPEEQNLEKANAFLRAWTRQHNKAALSMAIPLIVSFILARFIPSVFANMVMVIGAAVGLTIGVSMIPEDFRSRNGSLRPAVCLVAGMWVVATAITVLTLMGELSN